MAETETEMQREEKVVSQSLRQGRAQGEGTLGMGKEVMWSLGLLKIWTTFQIPEFIQMFMIFSYSLCS